MVYFYIYIKTAREFGHEKLARHLILYPTDSGEMILGISQTKTPRIKIKQ
jgi:hypothetical protein